MRPTRGVVRRRMGRWIAAGMAIALVLAACGGDDGADDPPPASDDGADDTAADEPADGDATDDDASDDDASDDSADAEPAASGELTQVELFLPLPVLTVAMFPPVVADAMGFFEEEGLDVTLNSAGGSGLVVQQMAAGNADAALLISGPVIGAIEQQQDLVAVHDFILRPMFDLIVTSDSDITTYEDFEGKVIGVDGLEAGEVPELRGDLAAVGLQEGSDYSIVVLGDDHALAYEQVEQGRADAISLAYNERVVLEHNGYDMRIVEPPYTLDEARPAVPLVVTRDFFDDHREAVVGLGRAINKAIVFAHANPDATLDIMRDAFPPEHEDTEFTRVYLEAGLELSDPYADGVDEQRFGEMSMTGWQQLAELLSENGVDVEQFVTNELIDEMNDFDRDAVVELAESSDRTYP